GGGHYVFSKSTQQYIFLDATDRILKSGAQVDDGSMRFTLEGPADSLRLRVQANQLVWHEDGTNDQLISTRFGVEDNFTVFKLIPVSGTPNPGGGGQGSGLRPIGASSSNPHPSMAAFVNPDQSLDVAWRSTDGKIFVSTYSAPDYRLVRQIAVENSLGLFGGYTKDENGIGYLLTARPEQLGVNGDDGMQRNAWLRRPNVLHLLRIPPGGESQFFVDLNQESIYQTWGIYNPMQTGANITSRLAYGSGSVVASFAHNIPGGGHMHTTGTLIGVSPTGTSTYAKGAGNHSMSNQVWFDGINFVQIQEGDQGILMSRLIPAGNGQWSWSGDKLVYRHASAEPLADPSAPDPISDLEEFVRFGSVQNAGPNYMILFSRKQGQGFVYGLKD
ncbi:MAG: hypothetical protein KDA36_13110, partial [Planctomycetaceae bacterium]|nr:hypothetical protein [Planctomycetaceae bacterium]